MKLKIRVTLAAATIMAIGMAQTTAAIAGPFTVSSPSASTSSKIKIGME